MKSTLIPTATVLRESQLSTDSPHSILIALLRGAAAIQVAAAHLRSQFFPGLRTLDEPQLWFQILAFLTGFAHQAVVVFFLISGWLVGGSLLNKLGQPDAVKLYAIDRLTRLWTVLVPTFVLMLAIGIVTQRLEPRALDFSMANDYSVLSFAGNLVGLQTILVQPFGGNFPLWSLANETWYYLMFPLLTLAWCAPQRTRRGWLAVALIAIAVWLPLPILLYFSIWLLGAAFSRVRIDCSRPFKLAVLVLLLTLSATFRLTGHNDDQTVDSFPQDLLLSLPLLLLLSASVGTIDPRRAGTARLKRVADFFSEFSFTLYVVHIPVLGMMAYVGSAWFGASQLQPHQFSHLAIYLGMLLFVIAFAYGFYLLFEAHTRTLRALLRQWLMPRAVLTQPVA